MTNEQIIYLGPEEELTSVRERLENTQAGRIVLVIPPQTQLRSHVGWRLLHSRMRELGKDVLVISSDRQIRAVAKAVGFRVADSQETSPSNRPRLGSRPTRTDTGGRTNLRSRTLPGKSMPDNRTIRPGLQPNQQRRAINEDERQQVPQSRSVASRKQSRAGKAIAAEGVDAVSAASSTFNMQDIKLETPYELHIETTPSARPLLPEEQDEEPDTLTEDYHVARSIREAAQGRDAGTAVPPSGRREPSSGRPGQSDMTSHPAEMDDDLFSYMEDNQPVPLPEQRASTYIQDIEPEMLNISDIPTEVQEPEIEDLGDEGDIRIRQDSSPDSLGEPIEEEADIEETQQVYGTPPRDSRTGENARPKFEDFGDGDELLPIPDRPIRVAPSTARTSGAIAASSAGRQRGEPRPIIQSQPQARHVSTTPPTQQTRKPISTKGSRNVTKPPVSKPVNKGPSLISNHRASRITAIVFISFVVLVLAVLAFLFFGANATVTITVPSQLLNSSAPYEASINRNDTQHNTIPSQVLTYTASVTDQGTATGTTRQGNSIAAGTVIFTNRGSQPLDIPTGTVLSTSIGTGAVQFLTTADVLVQPANSNNYPAVVPVQAKYPGDNGNVAFNSISIIPPDSLTKIASNNQIPKTSVNLSVTNPNPTNGGGAANVQAVSTNDVNTLEKSLRQQLRSQVTKWLATAVHKGDVQGTPIPNVLGSSTPLPGEKLVTIPAVGQPTANGKFTGILSINISVLVIRSAAIQAMGRTQLMAAALKEKPVSVLATQLPINATVAKSIPSKDGTTLTIDVTAAGHVVQRVSAQDISNLVAGKGVDQAKSDIMNGAGGINSVINTRIDIFPPFLGIIPFRPEQIHVIVQPGPVS